MANNIEWDVSDFESKLTLALMRVKQNTLKAVNDVATTVLQLSANEVPIHTVTGEPGGALQNSGHIQEAKDIENPEAIVGYNTPYAAYQHEGMRKDGTHVVSSYTNARSKKKFLEDPIRVNLNVFNKYFLKLLN